MDGPVSRVLEGAQWSGMSRKRLMLYVSITETITITTTERNKESFCYECQKNPECLFQSKRAAPLTVSIALALSQAVHCEEFRG